MDWYIQYLLNLLNLLNPLYSLSLLTPMSSPSDETFKKRCAFNEMSASKNAYTLPDIENVDFTKIRKLVILVSDVTKESQEKIETTMLEYNHWLQTAFVSTTYHPEILSGWHLLPDHTAEMLELYWAGAQLARIIRKLVPHDVNLYIIGFQAEGSLIAASIANMLFDHTRITLVLNPTMLSAYTDCDTFCNLDHVWSSWFVVHDVSRETIRDKMQAKIEEKVRTVEGYEGSSEHQAELNATYEAQSDDYFCPESKSFGKFRRADNSPDSMSHEDLYIGVATMV